MKKKMREMGTKAVEKNVNELALLKKEGLKKITDVCALELIRVYLAMRVYVVARQTKIIESLEAALSCELDSKQRERLEGQLYSQKINFQRDLMVQSDNMFKTLLSLLFIIRLAVNGVKGYASGSGVISFYFVPFSERFIVPALENQLSSNWDADSIWKKTVNTQILQTLSWRAASWWEPIFADAKKAVLPQDLSALIKCVCEKECGVDLKELRACIVKLRGEREDWPEE